MIEIASVIAQVLTATLALGALVVLARAQREKPGLDHSKRPLQPVPIRVEHNPRER